MATSQKPSELYIASVPFGESEAPLTNFERLPNANVWMSKRRGYHVSDVYNAIQSRFHSQESRVYSVFSLPVSKNCDRIFSVTGKGLQLRKIPDKFQIGISYYILGGAHEAACLETEIDSLDSRQMMAFYRPTTLVSMNWDFAQTCKNLNSAFTQNLNSAPELENMLLTIGADGCTLIKPHVQMVELETVDGRDVLDHHEVWETHYQ